MRAPAPKSGHSMPPIVFFGTDAYAAPVLRALFDAGYPIPLVVTKPDEPAGRRRIPSASPIKRLAHELGLAVWQPEKLDDLALLKKTGAEAYVLAAYGKLLPRALLDMPRCGVLNIHPSLLPRYRGPSPLQSALLNGDTETGVTVMLLDEKMDHGPILAQETMAIGEHEKAPELGERLFSAGAKLLIATLPEYLRGACFPKPQDETRATYCTLIKREDGLIDWHKPAHEIYNQFRAFTPWPGIFTFIQMGGKKIRIKLLDISPRKESIGASAGDLIANSKIAPLVIACADGYLQINRLQMEGGTPVSAEEFLNGYKNIIPAR